MSYLTGFRLLLEKYFIWTGKMAYNDALDAPGSGTAIKIVSVVHGTCIDLSVKI